LLGCAHTGWKSSSAPLFFCTSGKETAENLNISRGQRTPCQDKRIRRLQTVISAGCKVLQPNAGFLLASMPSCCRFRPIECCYSQSVSVAVPQAKIRESAIELKSSHGSRSQFMPEEPEHCQQLKSIGDGYKRIRTVQRGALSPVSHPATQELASRNLPP